MINKEKKLSAETEMILAITPNVVGYLVSVLKSQHCGISTAVILNIVVEQLAGTITAKRVKYQETRNTGYPNCYALVLMQSGFGKDRILKDIRTYFLKNFWEWHQQKIGEYQDKCRYQIENSAIEKFPKDDQINQRQAYVEEECRKIRNIVHEVSSGTSEGLFADAKAIHNAGFGSVNLLLSEGGNFLNCMTPEQKQFFNRVYEAYDGIITSKSIKGENREESLTDIPTNVLILSDPTSFQGKGRDIFNSLMELGIGRRSMISFLPKKIRYDIEPNAQKAYLRETKYYENLEKLSEVFAKIFAKIVEGSIYELTFDAYKVFYQYRIKIKKLTDAEDNSLLSKEIASRELKSLKLSCLYAALNHPDDAHIHPQDIEQAIASVEFLSSDVKKFYRYKPKYDDRYDQLLDFFLEHEGQEFTKTELVNNYHQEFGYSRDMLRKEFLSCIETLNEAALLKGYYIEEKSINRGSGNSYSLLRITDDVELNENFIPLTELVIP